MLSADDITAVFVSKAWLKRPPEPHLPPPVPCLRYEASNITSISMEASAYVFLRRAFLTVRMVPPSPCDPCSEGRLGFLKLGLRFGKLISDLLVTLL